MSITMIVPAGLSQVNGRLGSSYTPDANNLIYNVNANDVNALIAAGCYLVPPALAPSSFGAGTATIFPQGNIHPPQISAAGINPGATGADNVLAAYTLPANSFDVAGRVITINAAGSFAATSNNKRVKIIVNPASATVGSTVGASGVTVCDTGTVTTSGAGWALTASVVKYGAAGSNTQLGLHEQAQIGAAVSSMLAPSAITATESGAILIAITGNATTAATDIVFNFLAVNALN